jgi:hypothetical protein
VFILFYVCKVLVYLTQNRSTVRSGGLKKLRIMKTENMKNNCKKCIYYPHICNGNRLIATCRHFVRKPFFECYFSTKNAAMNIITIAILIMGAAYIALQILQAMGVVNI